MSEQPTSASSFETHGYGSHASLLESGARFDLHVGSDLPSPEEGREIARQRVQEALGQQERPPEYSPEFELLTYGTHTVDIRMWERELAENVGPTERIFREVRTNFGRRAAQMERSYSETQATQPATAADDMMGYELTNTGS